MRPDMYTCGPKPTKWPATLFLHGPMTWRLCCHFQLIPLEWWLGFTINPNHWPLCTWRLKMTAELRLGWDRPEPFPQQFMKPPGRGSSRCGSQWAEQREEALSAHHSTTSRQEAQPWTTGTDWRGHFRPVIFGSELHWCYYVYPEFLSFIFWFWLQTNKKEIKRMIFFYFLMIRLHLLVLKKTNFSESF